MYLELTRSCPCETKLSAVLVQVQSPLTANILASRFNAYSALADGELSQMACLHLQNPVGPLYDEREVGAQLELTKPHDGPTGKGAAEPSGVCAHPPRDGSDYFCRPISPEAASGN